MSVADEVFAIFARRGGGAYFGEAVSITEHSLQTAHFAERGAAQPPLVVAALLHDIGHLIGDAPDSLADWTVDARHEQVGADWLAARFGPEVSEPVRLHVPAKRYLCATHPRYFERLSPASVVTLGLQGGPMNASEIASFEAEPYYRDALRLRAWDEEGKMAGLRTRGLLDYRAALESLPVPGA
jgi:[1-hydroxy-2-(trimethylamino)ethyl]phosphonate dioxygenase